MSQVTSIELLQQYMLGTIVELPEFGPNQPFVARLRRPSVTNLVRSGRIPNELLNTAAKLFTQQQASEMMDMAGIEKVLSVLDVFAEAALIEPKYADLRAAGVELTDEQKTAIYNYCQEGARALAPFRRQQEDSGAAQHEHNLPGAALGASGPY